jgi:hypothetical protein
MDEHRDACEATRIRQATPKGAQDRPGMGYRVLGARPILREPRPVVVADAFDEALALLVQWRTPSPRPRSSSATRKRYFGAAAKAR